MFLAKVIGHVVASQKAPEFQGMKLLLIQPYINKGTDADGVGQLDRGRG